MAMRYPIACLFLALASCGGGNEGEGGAGNAAASAPAARTLAQVAGQPFAPERRDFTVFDLALPPGGVAARNGVAEVRLERATVTPTGIDFAVSGRPTGDEREFSLNYADRGVLADDRGNVMRLRDPGDKLMAERGKGFRATIRAGGFPDPNARRYVLTLDTWYGGPRGEPLRFEVALPEDWRSRLRAPAAVRHAWTLDPVAGGSSPAGNLAARVFGLDPLANGVAVSLEMLNGARDMKISPNSANWAMKLYDDRGTVMRIVEQPDLDTRDLAIRNGFVARGRLLFSGLPHPQATRLWLVTNRAADWGANPPPRLSPDQDNMFAPAMAIDLGSIPADFPRGVESKKMSIAQPPLVAEPYAGSSITLEALKRDLGARQTDRGTVVDLPVDVFFDFDKAVLKPGADATIAKLVDLLGRLDGRVAIEGHSDGVGAASYNLPLSRRRAEAVRAALTARGLDAARFRTAGYGAARPRAPEKTASGVDDPAARAQNRRVEVIVEKL